MQTELVENTIDGAWRLDQPTNESSTAWTLMSDVFEDGKRKAQRTAQRAIVATEVCVEDTTYYIKRNPWQSVGVAAGFGIVAGLFARWLVARAARGCAADRQAPFQAVER